LNSCVICVVCVNVTSLISTVDGVFHSSLFFSIVNCFINVPDDELQ
jgi:hypothetical protein